MLHLSIRIDDNHSDKVRELKTLLKCKSNDEIFEKIINIAYKDLKKEEK